MLGWAGGCGSASCANAGTIGTKMQAMTIVTKRTGDDAYRTASELPTAAAAQEVGFFTTGVIR
jgi:hypothetical protein